MDIRFDNRVAIVTGAGTGLGRSHALGLAARGAKVMVNDLGVTTDGQGSSSAAAEAVAQEIRDAGGEAMAHGCDVSDEAGVKDMASMRWSVWNWLPVWSRSRSPFSAAWRVM